MNNLSIKTRIWLAMAFMALILMAIGSMSIVGLRNANQSLENVYSVQVASTISIENSMVSMLRARTALDRIVLHPDAPEYGRCRRSLRISMLFPTAT